MTAKKLILEELIKGRDELQAQLDELKDAIAFLDVCITTGKALAESIREHEEAIPEEIIDIPEPEPTFGTVRSFTLSQEDITTEYPPVDHDPEPVIKNCLNCGAPFHVKKIGRMPQIYCSKNCNNQYNRNKRKEEEKKKIFGSKNTDLDAKLAQIKATCPAPTKRPDIQRDM